MSSWPAGFPQIPDEDWARSELEDLGLHYDTVERHGWYTNLDPTVAALGESLRPQDLWVDYSGGTGILFQRVLGDGQHPDVRAINADSSPKFLRVCLEKFRNDERIAYRRLHWLRAERRLQRLDEVLGPFVGKVDVLTSTNAIHLYDDLEATLDAWLTCLRRDGSLLFQSGNIGGAPPGSGWLIDDTVRAIAREARVLGALDPRWREHHERVESHGGWAGYDGLLNRFFPPVRDLDQYLLTLEQSGFEVRTQQRIQVQADSREWLDFLAVYHDGIVGWVGGSSKLGAPVADAGTIQLRHELMEAAASRVFDAKEGFAATWTHVTATRP